MSASGDEGALTLDTSAPSGRLARLGDLVLEGEVVDGHACFWVTARSGCVTSLVWPRGHVAKRDPLRVETADGRVRAAVGEPLVVGGHGSESPGCRAGSRKFLVRELDPDEPGLTV